MLSVAVVVLFALGAVASYESCTPSDPVCTLQNPSCTQYAYDAYYCTACSIVSPILAGGGSCQCNPATSYCSTDTATLGFCVPYTIYGASCTQDSQCQTSGNNNVNSGVTEQLMFCVGGQCKPCSQTLWAQYKVANAPNYTYTCPGYNAAWSQTIGRYATTTPMPGFTFRCLASGDVEIINATIDYNYGYTYSYASTTTAAATTAAAATVAATTAHATVGAASTTATGHGAAATTSAAAAKATRSSSRSAAGTVELAAMAVVLALAAANL